MNYLVAVRALCNFTAKHGDLDLRFTPSPSAQEGIAGHLLVASRRPDSYQSEVSLQGDYKTLTVRGRADGYDPEQNRLEEVKTYRGDLHAMADNRRHLHWAQLKIYGWLLCADKGLETIELSLVYFDVASLQETPLTEHHTAHELRQYFEAQCERFLAWAEQEMAHRQARDAALATLTFPHADFRPGQRALAEAVYKTTMAGRCLMAQAPTGIGKTIGTVFPLLKATPGRQLDKLFFLAAKTPGRQLALDALERIQGHSSSANPSPQTSRRLPLRVLELVARDKACEHPDKACHGDACPLAKGFYDRLPEARSAAVAHAALQGPLDRSALRRVALSHSVCPYYLSQELAVWADVVVGDYNYYFDSSALLYSLTTAHQWRVGVLVDEAHNLVERGRKMYSAQLDQTQLQQVYATAPRAVKGALQRLNKSLHELHQTQVAPYVVHAELPTPFLKVLQQTLTQITDFLVANPTRVDAALQAFYFEALQFSRMADAFAEHSLFDITLQDDNSAGGAPAAQEQDTFTAGPGAAVLNIHNVVPATFLAPRFTAAQAVTLFSATLSPQTYHHDLLGLPASAAWIDVASPFTHRQLRVSVVSNVSTRYAHRGDSLAPIADLMAGQYARQPGNYLTFASSYDYLLQLATTLQQRHPQIPQWTQTRGMEERARDAFLARFTPASQGIGFAVLGGPFAEGIDLPGARLIGAFIATLGLPQINPVNEQIRERMAANFNASLAHDYTYLYPGLQKVVQAAGRVIRTTSDQGVVYLMDDRFTRAEVQALFPRWWQVERLQASRPHVATA